MLWVGKKLHDGDDLLNTAREWLEKSRKHRLNGEFTEAYTDSQLALRAVRLLMREHWDAAVQWLTTPKFESASRVVGPLAFSAVSFGGYIVRRLAQRLPD